MKALKHKYYDGPVTSKNDIHINCRYFAYEAAIGLVAGIEFNVTFTVDHPAKEVWPYFKDFNLWQNSYGHYYTGVVGDLYCKENGDLGEQTFSLGSAPNTTGPYQYRVLRVVPERVIAQFQPIPEDGSTGGVSPGLQIFLVDERDGKTVVTIYMDHAVCTKGKSEDEALRRWRDLGVEGERKWRDIFIPELRVLVDRNAGRS